MGATQRTGSGQRVLASGKLRKVRAFNTLRGAVLRCVGYLTVCLLQVPSLRAQEERATAVLRYERGPELEGCQSDASLRRSVAAHLGYDPFRGTRGIVVDASIERAAPGLVAHVQAKGEDGAPLGKRELRSERGDCVELSRALALAISVAIDPFVLSRVQTPSDAPIASEPEPLAEPVETQTPAKRSDELEAEASTESTPVPNGDSKDRERRPYLSLDASLGWGFVPAPRGALSGGVYWPLMSMLTVQAELRVDLPASDDGPRGGSVTASLAGARVHACAAGDRWGVCLGTAQSLLFASGTGVDDTESAQRFVPAAAALAYLHLWRGPRWLVQARIGADVPLKRVSLDINGESAFRSARVAPYGGLGLGFPWP